MNTFINLVTVALATTLQGRVHNQRIHVTYDVGLIDAVLASPEHRDSCS
jgi:hypothetical protein